MRWTAALILSFLPVLAMAGTLTETVYFDQPAGAIDIVTVNCGAGILEITGIPDIDSIRIVAEIETENMNPKDLPSFIRDNIHLELTQQGNTAVITSVVKQQAHSTIETRINLSMEIPLKTDVVVTDGSGSIQIRNIQGNVEIHDDSGEIVLSDVVGPVVIDDGSGSIEVTDCRGPVVVKDGSGSISIDTIKGDVMITDGSGILTILHVAGSVTVTDDSGDIDISDVSGSVLINAAGTGELNLDRIKGKVTILD